MDKISRVGGRLIRSFQWLIVVIAIFPLQVFGSPAPVKLSPVLRGPVEYHVSSYGVLSPNIEELSFQIPGRIERFLVEQGDHVQAGQPLAMLETMDAKDALRTARVALDQSARRLERMKALRVDGSIGQSQLEDAEDNQKQQKIAFAQAEVNLSRCELVAPDDGVILEEIVDSRTSVIPGTAIYSFQSDNEAWQIKVGLIDRHAFTFKKGSVASVKFSPFPGEIFSGAVTRLSGIADNKTGLFTAEIAVRTEGRELRPGMLATVDLFEETEGLYFHVPLDALTQLKDQRAIIFVRKSNALTIDELDVTIAAIAGDRVFLKEDLSEFPDVVVRGQRNLSQSVSIQAID